MRTHLSNCLMNSTSYTRLQKRTATATAAIPPDSNRPRNARQQTTERQQPGGRRGNSVAKRASADGATASADNNRRETHTAPKVSGGRSETRNSVSK